MLWAFFNQTHKINYDICTLLMFQIKVSSHKISRKDNENPKYEGHSLRLNNELIPTGCIIFEVVKKNGALGYKLSALWNNVTKGPNVTFLKSGRKRVRPWLNSNGVDDSTVWLMNHALPLLPNPNCCAELMWTATFHSEQAYFWSKLSMCCKILWYPSEKNASLLVLSNY